MSEAELNEGARPMGARMGVARDRHGVMPKSLCK
jgi:hypothetical protein